jgi:hypothetical protein
MMVVIQVGILYLGTMMLVVLDLPPCRRFTG